MEKLRLTSNKGKIFVKADKNEKLVERQELQTYLDALPLPEIAIVQLYIRKHDDNWMMDNLHVRATSIKVRLLVMWEDQVDWSSVAKFFTRHCASITYVYVRIRQSGVPMANAINCATNVRSLFVYDDMRCDEFIKTMHLLPCLRECNLGKEYMSQVKVRQVVQAMISTGVVSRIGGSSTVKVLPVEIVRSLLSYI
jgi:hypothetical protein